jgi:glycine/D-amino acid oxidase-like deaminating enzyme/nitrite reductase/ring-hydroxylating ferredoxin subunit
MTLFQETQSVWQEVEPPFLPSLSSHESVDVCVIGGGIAGLTAAYRLLEEGRTVAVLERNGFRQGETLHTTGHLTAVIDGGYSNVVQRHGLAKARLVATSHASAIDDIEQLARSESIDCDFTRVPGFTFLAPGHRTELLERELAACLDAGVPGVEAVASAQSPLFPTGPCLRYPRQARIHAGRYVTGLARAVERRGGRIYAHTEVSQLEEGSAARVITNRGFQVVCEKVILTTNSPLGGVVMHTKMAPYRTYVVGIELAPDRADLSLFWDTASPYHYVRTVTVNGRQLLLVGGEDHRTGYAPNGDPFAALTAWARDRLGVTGPVRYHWSGQVLEPHDGLAYIGAYPGHEERMLLVTGHSGNGLTYGTMAARILTDLVLGQPGPYAAAYEPSRINIRSLGKYVSENAFSAAPYADWLTPGDVTALEDIPAGEGAVMREGAHKLAVFRDEHGKPTFLSATCPHLNGVVRWNTTEKTWDCPCHGSRFDRYGHVINGPATTGLAAVDTLREDQGEEAIPA